MMTRFSKLAVLLPVASSFFLSLPGHSQATIGAPSDGIHYSVESTKEVTKSDALDCGHNDTGVANVGVFHREHRKYVEYRDSKLIRTWYDDVDVFDHCHEP
jgi:hypothetical protein